MIGAGPYCQACGRLRCTACFASTPLGPSQRDILIAVGNALGWDGERCSLVERAKEVMETLTTVRQQVDTMLAVNDELTTERDALKAEVNWLRTDNRLANETFSKVNAAINRAGIHCALFFWEAIDQITADRDRMRPVYEASIALRRAESTDVPGDSIAEIEGNRPAAQRRTAIALLKWREAIDTALAASADKEAR